MVKKSEVSKIMADFARMRKNKVGGFNDPSVQKRALQARKKNYEAKRTKEQSQTTETTQE